MTSELPQGPMPTQTLVLSTVLLPLGRPETPTHEDGCSCSELCSADHLVCAHHRLSEHDHGVHHCDPLARRTLKTVDHWSHHHLVAATPLVYEVVILKQVFQTAV